MSNIVAHQTERWHVNVVVLAPVTTECDVSFSLLDDPNVTRSAPSECESVSVHGWANDGSLVSHVAGQVVRNAFLQWLSHHKGP